MMIKDPERPEASRTAVPGLARVSARPLHILLVGGQSDSLTILRGSLIQAMVARGHRVSTAAGQPEPHVLETLADWGVDYHEIPIERAGLNLLKDLGTVAALVRLMARLKPDVVLGYQAKPLNYAMIAGTIAGVPRRVGLVTGLGYAFTEGAEAHRRAAAVFVSSLYRVALRLSHGVIFQNEDDRQLFVRQGLVGRSTPTLRVNGSGVDLAYYTPVPLPKGPPRFLMIARVLKDKGVYEYVEAARRVKREIPEATFTLVGPFDPNPAAIRPDEVQAWVDEGLLDYRGPLRDVRPAIAEANVVVLPSYREGVPKTLLEAMAMGRPTIATDVPGCRDAVVDHKNGLLVPVRDIPALTGAMTRLAHCPNERRMYAIAGRMRAVELFDCRSASADVTSFVEGA